MRNLSQITGIIVHCADVRSDWMSGHTAEEKVDEIRRWHVEDNGWSDIGYHFLIDRDGTVAKGRDRDLDGDVFEEIGAHVKGHNTNTIGIVLVGGHGSAATDDFTEHYTHDQSVALRNQIANIEAQVGRKLKLSGHNEYANKACPGFTVQRWWNERPPQRSSPVQSKTLQASQVTKVAAAASPVAAFLAKIPWQTVAVLGALALVIIIATGVIDLERLKKWRAGDR